LLLAWGAGCAVDRGKVFIKDGIQYGVTPDLTWRGRWWDYYQRGLSYAAGAFWPEAIADFHAAIAQRRADQRFARTYGVWFVDYFPHRELGIAYYSLGRYADAIHELEVSLRTADTAKAKFYLNRARREQLKQSGRDTAAPQIVLNSPAGTLWTNRLTLTIAGRAVDDTYVSSVSIQGQPLFIELAEPLLAFTQDVQLTDGLNVIDIVAADLLGHQAHERLTVHVDRQAPLVSVERAVLVEEAAQQRAIVAGLVADQSPIKRFLLGDRAVPVLPETIWEFHEEIGLAADMASLPFEIEDAAGNVTRGQIALPSAASGQQGIREGKSLSPPPLSPSLPLPLSLPRWAALSPEAVVSDTATLASSQTVPQTDRHPPVMRLAALDAEQIVYNDEIYLGGEISATSAIVAFSINGASQLPAPSARRRQSRQLFFGTLVSLQVGSNRFLLEAQDEAGLVTQHEVVVTRHVREVMRLEARLHIAVFPSNKEDEGSGLRDAAYDSLLAAFVQQKRFRLLERERLEDILREHGLRGTRFVDLATAIRVGKLAAAEASVPVTVSQKAPQALEVLAHFVDVETTERLATVDVYGENLTLRDVKTLMQGLAWKFQQHFPLTEGVVLERQRKHVLVAHGNQAPPLKQYMKVILFREGEAVTDGRTGTLPQRRTENLGEARVEEVSDAFARAVLLKPASTSDIRKADKYITNPTDPQHFPVRPPPAGVTTIIVDATSPLLPRQRNGTPAAPYRSLTEAMRALQGGQSPQVDTLFVRAGTYAPQTTQETFPLDLRGLARSPFTFQGAGRDTTIIDAAFTGDVLLLQDSDTPLVIDGFTLTHGATGLLFNNVTGLTLRQNLIEQHILAGINLGINTRDTTTAENTIVENIIRGNRVGIGLFEHASAAITDNLIADNVNHGILVTSNATARITHNTIKNNLGAGVLVALGATAELTANVIAHNGQHGVSIQQHSTATLRHNTIRGNMSDGISVTEGSIVPYIEANTISNNRLRGIIISSLSLAEQVTGNTIERNLFGVVVQVLADASLFTNVIRQNLAAGVEIFAATATIAGGDISQNGDDGIALFGFGPPVLPVFVPARADIGLTGEVLTLAENGLAGIFVNPDGSVARLGCQIRFVNNGLGDIDGPVQNLCPRD
jgi:hypothetical protein